ncbi:MAG: hypothetical protein ACE5F2_01155 [Candidatus Paceibacteria bacterium]
MKYSENKNLNEITNINANSPSFNFLRDEPDIYSIVDKITPKNIHKEIDFGKSVGKEIW